MNFHSALSYRYFSPAQRRQNNAARTPATASGIDPIIESIANVAIYKVCAPQPRLKAFNFLNAKHFSCGPNNTGLDDRNTLPILRLGAMGNSGY